MACTVCLDDISTLSCPVNLKDSDLRSNRMYENQGFAATMKSASSVKNQCNETHQTQQ